MPQITITFNGTQTDLDDFCLYNNQYEREKLSNETKAQYFIRRVKNYVFEAVKSQRIAKATNDADRIERNKEVNF